MAKLSKHDRYVKELCDRIADQYDALITNVKIGNKRRCFGEVDVLAKKGEALDLYEVKCSHRPTKARKQLTKLRKYVKGPGRSFFYCGSSRMLMAMQV